MIKDLGNRSQ